MNPAVTYAASQPQGRLFWIVFKRPAFLSSFSCLQLIQNSAPSVAGMRQCDIRIDLIIKVRRLEHLLCKKWCLRFLLFFYQIGISQKISVKNKNSVSMEEIFWSTSVTNLLRGNNCLRDLYQYQTVCTCNNSPFLTTYPATISTWQPYTAMRILERLGVQTSSFVIIW